MRKKIFYQLFLILCITSLAYNPTNAQNWALVMSEKTGFTDQIWRTRNHFPKAEIEEFWSQGYAITSLSHFNGLWALVMSKGAGYGLQYWTTAVDFPQDKIQQYWDKSYRITHLTYGDGLWCVIMTKNAGLQEQIWRTRYEFPAKDIEEFWDKGYYITSLDYGNGLWALVMSKGSKFEDQSWRTRTNFPQKEIEELWDEGYHITNLTYGKGLWALVMSKGTGYGDQMWRTRNEFPQKEIQEYWDKSYDITGIYHGVESTQPVVYQKPTVNWNIPSNPTTKVAKPDYTLKACVKSETPLSKVELFVNGILVKEERGYEVVPDDGCDNTIERKIKLNKGNNTVKLTVTNKGGSVSTDVRTIVYQEPTQVVVNNTNTNNTNTNNTNTNNTNTTKTNEKRLALIIGNSKYAKSPLRNPVNDARAIEASLKSLGFDVMKYEDLDQNTMKRAIDEFGSKLKTYQVGLFFYAGHGLQVKGNNYLVPVNANINEETDVELECVDAGRLLTRMEASGSKVNIIILDACRDNPFERSWSRSTKGNGLASMDAPLGSIVCYATAPGKTASDGSGNNGLYTEQLLKYLKIPNLTLEEVFKRVRIDVVMQSNKQQTPWESSSLVGDFYFNKK